MLTRQKILLRLLADAGGSFSRIELFKLAFLLSKEGKSDSLRTFYEFMPYLYGPYSFTLSHEIDHLLRSGAIKLPDKDTIQLTPYGQKLGSNQLDPTLLRDLKMLSMNYGTLDQNSLITAVYERFPWFTVNSVKPARRKVVKNAAPCKNYTVGYQGLQVDGLLNLLLEQGIQKLIDTRLNPVSRRYGFHKSTLSALCKRVDIEYLHIPEVGVPSEWRQELDTIQSYRQLFQRYESNILDQQGPLLRQLAQVMIKKPSALLCRESDCEHCHRSKLAIRLSAINGLPIDELSVADERAV